jgi:hypothetical protein
LRTRSRILRESKFDCAGWKASRKRDARPRLDAVRRPVI